MPFELLDVVPEEVSKNTLPSPTSSKKTDTPTSNDRYQLLEESAEPESWSDWALRTGAQFGSRVLEATLGSPGTVAEGYRRAAGINPESNKQIGEMVSKIGESYGHKPIEPDVLERSQQTKPSMTLPDIPEVREQLKGEGGREPRGSGEQFVGDVIEDATLLLLSQGKNLLQGKPNTLVKSAGNAATRAAAQSLVGNAGKWVTQFATGSEFAGNAVKTGLMILANMYGAKDSLKNLKNESYEQADKNLPPDEQFDFTPEQRRMDKLIRQTDASDRKDKDFLLDRYRSFNKLLSKDQPSKSQPSSILNAEGKPARFDVTPGKKPGLGKVKEVWDLKKGWGTWYDKNIDEDTLKQLNRGIGIVNGGLSRYGAKNEAWYNPYKIAEELDTAFKAQSTTQNFIKKHPILQRTANNPIVKHLLYGAAAKTDITPGKVAGLAATAATAGALKETADLMQILKKSPVAREHYNRFLNASVSENLPVALKSLNVLNNVLK